LLLRKHSTLTKSTINAEFGLTCLQAHIMLAGEAEPLEIAEAIFSQSNVPPPTTPWLAILTWWWDLVF